MRKALAAPAVAIAAAAFPLLTMTGAAAAEATSYQADLGALNDSGVSGTAMVTIDGDQAMVTIDAAGLLAGSPHAQHIHLGAEGTCPTPAADTDGDGVVSTPEAAPSYGPIAASLTTEGDTSPDSALAVERFPTAPGGTEDYDRTFTVGADVVDGLRNGTGVIVVHGVDLDDSGAYDGDAMSPLDPSLPLEATVPAACGVLEVAQMAGVPSGGADTGAGSTAGLEQTTAIGVGALALTGAAATGAVAYRRRAGNQA
ncbi:hypothetical protein O2V63_07910 [Modestobacter sp. VKM Ac-2977]|uniref:hypothetical protein n=1 Tax=Modestobacter sp. VKM Ac-2977 TaxID=3004131 RepID=UPI0022AA30AF|nr:hypothetical protein [Modestobacter sp. VKM Ac-2977]MCZ2820249.1 hypothetical protein [Modestobacter sp. VKM Ac-2977]